MQFNVLHVCTLLLSLLCFVRFHIARTAELKKKCFRWLCKWLVATKLQRRELFYGLCLLHSSLYFRVAHHQQIFKFNTQLFCTRGLMKICINAINPIFHIFSIKVQTCFMFISNLNWNTFNFVLCNHIFVIDFFFHFLCTELCPISLWVLISFIIKFFYKLFVSSFFYSILCCFFKYFMQF